MATTTVVCADNLDTLAQKVNDLVKQHIARWPASELLGLSKVTVVRDAKTGRPTEYRQGVRLL